MEFIEETPHPGLFLREKYVEPNGLNASELARLMDVDRNRISQLLRGKRDITADTAMRLARVFRSTPQYWMIMQMHYDLERHREKTSVVIQDNVKPLD